jgi:hypothetical protein
VGHEFFRRFGSRVLRVVVAKKPDLVGLFLKSERGSWAQRNKGEPWGATRFYGGFPTRSNSSRPLRLDYRQIFCSGTTGANRLRLLNDLYQQASDVIMLRRVSDEEVEVNHDAT